MMYHTAHFYEFHILQNFGGLKGRYFDFLKGATWGIFFGVSTDHIETFYQVSALP